MLLHTLIRTLLLGLIMGLLSGCGHFFYLPEPGLRGTPDQLGMPYADVHLRAADGTRLHGWWLPARLGDNERTKGVIYFLHGNAENISTHLGAMSWITFSGWDLFILDYRGFGLSQGSPDIPSVYQDAEAGLEWAAQQAQTRQLPLVVLGQSLGGAVAATLVAQSPPDQVSALILDSAFSSYRRIAREKLAEPWLTTLFRYPLAWTIRDDYSPEHYLAQRPSIPVLIMHGCADLVVPCSHGKRIHQLAGEPAWLWLSPEARHQEMLSRQHWRAQLLKWLEGQVLAVP
ncbi:alpha/beta hydrolase [Pseudomonas sp.]|uniref:alpha/beta hydrolase n=1 Tax=Pseudomonas sp. TaxID=306 RepID=UPI0019EB533F|nr:alpha/beta hydrolase [Pseudomonas sp.]MBF0674715.1 alpha/beta hydrolase [Pseudomonas sp.]